jgi:histidine triad (HIT) family protein
MPCVFCSRLAGGNLVAENDLAVAFPDAFPVTPGHCLVIPRRHDPDFLALTLDEQTSIWALLTPVCRHIEASSSMTRGLSYVDKRIACVL